MSEEDKQILYNLLISSDLIRVAISRINKFQFECYDCIIREDVNKNFLYYFESAIGYIELAKGKL
jgi:hypothetical protein